MKLTTIFWATLLAAAPIAAQDQDSPSGSAPQGQFGELIEISEVLLDVLVTDKDGNVVVDLLPEDFVVVEDGVKRPVTGASFYSNRFRVEEAQREGKLLKPAAQEVLSDRHFIFFFHDARRFDDPGRRIFRRQMDAIRKARTWVEEEMLGGDWVAIAGYDVKLKIFSDFTQNRGQLLEALDGVTKGKSPQNAWPSRRGDAEVANTANQPSLLAHLPEGDSLRDESTSIYEGISLVAEATSDILGRKNLMLFSIGFGDLRRTAGQLTSRPDKRYYPGLEQSLNDNNVAVYPIDLAPGNGNHAQTDFLNTLAHDSGGTYHYNFVNFISAMREVADEASGYYLLSYQAEHPSGETGYREVTIETLNKRLDVQARRGYRYGS